MLQGIGQCFGSSVYHVTSNAGEVALLIGVTFIVGLVQRDLVIAGSFANFLSKSNKAFELASNVDLQAISRDSSPVRFDMASRNESRDADGSSDLKLVVQSKENGENPTNLVQY